eukprot:1480381-Amphidinium_carterae.1
MLQISSIASALLPRGQSSLQSACEICRLNVDSYLGFAEVGLKSDPAGVLAEGKHSSSRHPQTCPGRQAVNPKVSPLCKVLYRHQAPQLDSLLEAACGLRWQ